MNLVMQITESDTLNQELCAFMQGPETTPISLRDSWSEDIEAKSLAGFRKELDIHEKLEHPVLLDRIKHL